MPGRRWVIAYLSLSLRISLHSATYFVSQHHPQASDENLGTAQRPWKTINKAATNLAPGVVVMIDNGVYREKVDVKTSGTAQLPIRFESISGAHVVLTGGDQISGWKKSDSLRPIYEVLWSHRFNTWSKNMTHPDDEYHHLIGRCEQVAVQGYLLHQVLERDQLSPGSFFADIANQKLVVWDISGRDPNKILVEASVRSEILRVEGEYVQIHGLHFRFAANAAQHGAVVLAGRHTQMENCILDSMNASGATFAAEDLVIRRCTFRDNGQLGFGAIGAHNLLFSQCVVENNNIKGFDRGWEAGGDKLVLSRAVVLERSQFVGNRGNGIWFDIGNENCTVKECLVAENEDSGIFYEISFGLKAHDNVIVGNGFATTPGAWGAQAGISLSSSPGCTLERNLIFGNREGFNFREQHRTTPRIGDPKERPVWNHNERIRRNIIASNRDAQVWGWFDLNDGRQWPAEQTSRRSGLPPPSSANQDLLAGPQVATNAQGQPTGLTLEQLELHFDENIYYARGSQSLFEWGVTWGRHKRFDSLQDFQSGLGLDKGSQVFEPEFADPSGHDFRLPAGAMPILKSCYPEGNIPGVLLGSR